MTHSPLPWGYTATGPTMRDNYTQPFAIYPTGDFDQVIGGLFGDVKGGHEQAEANAALIVKAVNAHAELVEALRNYRDDLKRPPAPDSKERRIAMVDALLAKVEQL